MENDTSVVKVDKTLVERAEKFIGPTKKYYFFKHFANAAFTELIEKLEGKIK